MFFIVVVNQADVYKRQACVVNKTILQYRAEHPDEYGRIVLLTTHACRPYTEFEFQPNDIILMGRESAGVPEAVHQAADARLLIPMNENARSINAVSYTHLGKKNPSGSCFQFLI